MAEQIISKRCPKCKQTKPLSDFHKDKSRKDGHKGYCNICRAELQRQYRQTEKGRTVSRRGALLYSSSKKGKTKRKQYRQGERGKAAEARYRKTEKGKAIALRSAKQYQVANPERVKAVNAVNIAIKAGKIPRPNTLQCHYCPAQAKDYHHTNYTPEHWLDVIPVCRKCHRSL